MDITKVEADLAVELWGKEAQIATFIEEIGEFLQAWNKLNRGAITEEEYVSEIADVYIMLQQMIYMNQAVFDKVYPVKLDKIRKKLQRHLEKEVEKNIEILLKEDNKDL